MDKLNTAEGRKLVIEKMTQAVMADRNKSYGDPEDNFTNIANLWNAYLQAKGIDAKLLATDVAVMSGLIKVARLATNQIHADSWVDLAGYAVCGGGIVSSKRDPAEMFKDQLQHTPTPVLPGGFKFPENAGETKRSIVPAVGSVWRNKHFEEVGTVVSIEGDRIRMSCRNFGELDVCIDGFLESWRVV